MYLKLYAFHINFHVYWTFPATGNIIAKTYNDTLSSMLDYLYKLQTLLKYVSLQVCSSNTVYCCSNCEVCPGLNNMASY